MGFKMKYEIIEDFLPIEKDSGKRRRQGRISTCECGAVHDTGVSDQTDQGNINWAKRTLNDSYAWANFFTDYDSIRISIPCLIDVNKIERACSVNSSATLDNELFGGNCNDIAVSGEMCYYTDKSKTWSSYSRFVFMWSYLGYFHKWKERFGTVSGRLIGHFQLQPHNRTDPMNAFKTIGVTWEQFLNDVDRIYDECLMEDNMVLNSKQKYYCRYKKELTGKGEKLAFIEFSATQALMDNPDCITPLPMIIWNPNTAYGKHPEMTYGILRDGLPDAEIYLLPNTSEGLRYAKEHGITIINASINNILASDDLELEIAKDILFVVATGNDGMKEHHEETVSCQNEWTLGAAGCYYWTNKPELYKHSSYGSNSVFNCGMTYLSYDRENPSLKYSGTSCATPWNSVLYNQINQAFKLEYGFNAPVELIKSFAIDHSEDFGEDDIRCGHGILRLPKEFDFSKYVNRISLVDESVVSLGVLCEKLRIDINRVPLYDGSEKLILSKDSKKLELFAHTGLYTMFNDNKLYHGTMFGIKNGEVEIDVNFASELLGFKYSLDKDDIIVYG